MTNNCQPRLLRFNHLPTLYRQWITTNPFDTLWFRREMDRLFSGPPYVAATEGTASTCSSYGRFERSFTLPRRVDAERVNASCENGVLSIVLPRAEEARPHRIQVATANGRPQIDAK